MTAPKRNTFTWLRAVTACDDIAGKAQALRLANAMFLSADNKSGLTWISNENLAALAGLPDRSNFRKQRIILEQAGSVTSGAIVDLSDDVRPKAFDPRGTYFQLDLDWAVRVVDSTTNAAEDEVAVVDLTTPCGGFDHSLRSISPQDVVDLTPLSLISPNISPDLSGAIDRKEGGRKGGVSPAEAIDQALSSGDCTPLLHVVWKSNTHLFDAAFGPGAYRYWDEGETLAGRIERFESMIAGKEISDAKETA